MLRSNKTRQYKCGCIAPKLFDKPTLRCNAFYTKKRCKITDLFSYLDVDCSRPCPGWGGDIAEQDDTAYLAEKRDNHLYFGKHKGESNHMPQVDWYDEVPKQWQGAKVLPYRTAVLPSFEARNPNWNRRNQGEYRRSRDNGEGEWKEEVQYVEEQEEQEHLESDTESAVFNSRLERRKR
jgi:hypothetical protein